MMDWAAFWESKAEAGSDFQATGRGLMDVAGYLHTVSEVVRILDLRQGEKLADVGCGVGLITLSLAPWCEHIYANDISPTMICRANSNLVGIDNVSLEIGRLTQLPLAGASVDKLLAYSVLQYLGDEANVCKAMSEVSRVLKPGGRALLAANPDPRRRDAYEASVLERAPQDPKQELALLDSVLWVEGSNLVELAAGLGMSASVEPISQRIWQHFYMFDLVLNKPK